jgi:HSP20 family protein
MRQWDPFRDLDTIRREIERVFQDAGSGRWPRVAFLPGRAARGYPLVNVTEDEGNLYLEALAPGLDPKSIGVSTLGEQVTISGEKKPANGGVKAEDFHRNERAAGRFTRTITLPSAVDQNRAKAEYTNGILKITLPKAEEAKPKQIQVDVG